VQNFVVATVFGIEEWCRTHFGSIESIRIPLPNIGLRCFDNFCPTPLVHRINRFRKNRRAFDLLSTFLAIDGCQFVVVAPIVLREVAGLVIARGDLDFSVQ
jgi:hypothetical protein